MEIWKTIPGWESYEASNLGRIRSIDRWIEYVNGQSHFYSSKILTPHIDRMGYFYVALCAGKQNQHLFSVHHLVCSAFHGIRPIGKQCRHLDGIKTNNKPGNLKWGTSKENAMDAIKHGTHNCVKNPIGIDREKLRRGALRRWKSKKARIEQSIRIKAAWKRIKEEANT